MEQTICWSRQLRADFRAARRRSNSLVAAAPRPFQTTLETQSLEVVDGSRVVEVRESLQGTLLAVRHLVPPGQVVNRATGRQLLRWRGDELDLLIPPEARLDLDDALLDLADPGNGGQAEDSAVPLPVGQQARLQVGELEIHVAWVRPTRRIPRSPRIRLDRRAAVSLAASMLLHAALLLLVFSVPPNPRLLEPSDLEKILIAHRCPTIIPPEVPAGGPPGPRRIVTRLDLVWGLLTGGVDPRGEELLGEPPALNRCAGRVPVAEVYAGHLTASGPRSARVLQRQLARRAGGLRTCYRAALTRCLGPGRLVVSLVITPRGEVTARDAVRSSWDREVAQSLEHCVIEAASSWSLPPVPAVQPTLVRLPLIFRYAGAPGVRETFFRTLTPEG